MTREEFIEQIAAAVIKIAPEYNISCYSAVIAQACLESGYGTRPKAAHKNYFGLKYRENRVTCNSGIFADTGSEQNPDGTYRPIITYWYEFATLEDCVRGYFQFTNTKSYQALKGVKDPLTYLQIIKNVGYATSIDYVQKVMNTLTSNNLQRFDTVKQEQSQPQTNGYTNSPLTNYTLISPNKTVGRTHKIDTITIHCVVGQLSVESLGGVFYKPERKASSNYGVGPDGRIGLYVEEKDRSWCSSNSENDHRSVTIEVASDKTEPYSVTDAALNATIKLVADICKRNGIKQLKWSENKNDRINHLNGCNMTVHRDFAAKSCPGRYLYERHGYIAEEVNKLLGNTTINNNNNEQSQQTQQINELYRVRKTWEDSASQIGAYKILDNAIKKAESTKGYSVFNLKGECVYKTKTNEDIAEEVIAGKWGNGSERKIKLTAAGYDYSIIQAIVDKKLDFKIGDKVKLRENATVYGTNTRYQQWVYDTEVYVTSITYDRIVISKTNTSGSVIGPVRKAHLKKI